MSNTANNLSRIIAGIKPVNRQWIEKAAERTALLVMPPRALGRLHDVAERICAIQKNLSPEIGKKAFVVMAGDHGVVAEGVSAFPQEVTGEMIKTFINGGAGINVLAGQVNALIHVVDMGIIPDLDPVAPGNNRGLIVRKVAAGTKNLASGPAMTRDQAETSLMTGFDIASDLFDGGIQILGTGDMGIGNTTPSAAIGAAITGCRLNDMVGPGTGVDENGLTRKMEVVRQALDLNRPDPNDGLDVLSKVGGFEIGGIAGCILAGAYHGHPIVIDGFISTAGALVAHALAPDVTGYLFAGHCSEEPGHRLMLDHLGLKPILDLGMRLGEGTGGALAMGIMDAAIRIFNDMATFEEAGVSEKEC
jgi:nicotinate-nucleotide--dimethylbenzimidazole phosphoribosyltransferase